MPNVALRTERFHDKHPNREGDHRSPSQRDRDRVLYSSAFRRLAEVTQVVAANSGYVFHNRLTHSLQVAQVGRRLAEKLIILQRELAEDTVDPDVVEAACVAHDLGHPPFGHVAEHVLNQLAESFGGFEGNAQSFRIVTKLASRSGDYGGLDLTRATLAAILKYPWLRGENPQKLKKWGAYSSEGNVFVFAATLLPHKLERTVEAQMMDWADDVTYSVHDLEDFYRAGRLPLHLLAGREPRERTAFFENVFERRKDDGEFQQRQELREAFRDVLVSTFAIPTAYNGSAEHRASLRDFTGTMIGRYINAAKLEDHGGVVRLSIDPQLASEVLMLKELIWTYVIEASSLSAQQYGQESIITELFKIYAAAATAEKTRGIFPTFYRERLREAQDEPEMLRSCVDLVASMTESQAIAMHNRLTGHSHGSGLEEILN